MAKHGLKRVVVKNDKNEIDVMVIHNNMLFVFEAKTQKKQKQQDKDKTWANEAIYKLAALNKQLGGIRTKPILVSVTEINAIAKKRASVFGIEILDYHKVERLEEELLRLFNGSNKP
jgi:ribosomal protein L3